MQKFMLDIAEDYPFWILGIAASTSDYRMCWSLNKALNLSLKRSESLSLTAKSKETSLHSIFTFEDQVSEVKYRLVQNKRGSSRVLAEATQADYLLILDHSFVLDYKWIITEVKKIRQVLMAFPIDLAQLKFKQNLLLTT